MNYKSSEEKRKYRNYFLFLVGVSTLGIILGFYLLNKTSFFDSAKDLVPTLPQSFNKKWVLNCLFDEMKIPFILFIFGFTLFSPYVSTIAVGIKGFYVSVGTFYLLQYQKAGFVSKRAFYIMCIATLCSLVIYIILGSKANCHASLLRSCAPNLKNLLQTRYTKEYCITFLSVCTILTILTVIKSYAPYINGV